MFEGLGYHAYALFATKYTHKESPYLFCDVLTNDVDAKRHAIKDNARLV